MTKLVGELLDIYCQRTPGQYGCQLHYVKDGCRGCNLRKLLGRQVGGGGCCAWSLEALPEDVAVSVLRSAIDSAIERGELSV